MLQFNLEKEDLTAMEDFIDFHFIQSIREDEDCDNIEYIASIIHWWDEIKRLKNEGDNKDD